jgi:hypothetical protein
MARDLDENNGREVGMTRLYSLCEEMLEIGDAVACAPILFRTIERLDRADLGAPGPVVHTLEKWRGTYEGLLCVSLDRKPTPVTVWMVNRILNGRPADAGAWLERLQAAARHPLASAETTARAAEFLKYQESSERGGGEAD